jgi:hypothetical protein
MTAAERIIIGLEFDYEIWGWDDVGVVFVVINHVIEFGYLIFEWNFSNLFLVMKETPVEVGRYIISCANGNGMSMSDHVHRKRFNIRISR